MELLYALGCVIAFIIGLFDNFIYCTWESKITFYDKLGMTVSASLLSWLTVLLYIIDKITHKKNGKN